MMTDKEFFEECSHLGALWRASNSDDARVWREADAKMQSLATLAKSEPSKEKIYEVWHHYFFKTGAVLTGRSTELPPSWECFTLG